MRVERDLRGLPGLGSVTSSASLLRPEIQIVPDPARAAAHFRKSFRLSRNPYDLSYYLADCLRARRQQKGQIP